MIVGNCGSKLFLLFVLSVAGMVGCRAQGGKSLSVKRVVCTASPECEAVPSLLDENGVEFHSIDRVNWKEYPYKPEVNFRIAHTGHEILLHYKVRETSVRAVAAGDNGPVWEDACVEFFVSPGGDDSYYNFECNCVGRLLIQGGKAGGRRPLASPEILRLVKRWSSLGTAPFEERLGECSWELVMVIPVSAFFRHTVGSLDGKTMTGNFYKCGDKLQTPHFLSWSPIGLEHPMFHCPGFFGTLSFE